VRNRFALILMAAVAVSGCEDDFSIQPWDDTPENISLFSLSRSDLIGLPSGYDFVNRRIVEVEQPGAGGNWDVALGGTATQLQLIPAAAFDGQATSRAAIAPITTTTYELLTQAPSDDAQYLTAPVNVTLGGVYVIRTRRSPCGFSTGVKFGKIKAVAVDAAQGTATFAVVVNPYCNDRSFVPPED
jgi:hypothetical protein